MDQPPPKQVEIDSDESLRSARLDATAKFAAKCAGFRAADTAKRPVLEDIMIFLATELFDNRFSVTEISPRLQSRSAVSLTTRREKTGEATSISLETAITQWRQMTQSGREATEGGEVYV